MTPTKAPYLNLSQHLQSAFEEHFAKKEKYLQDGHREALANRVAQIVDEGDRSFAARRILTAADERNSLEHKIKEVVKSGKLTDDEISGLALPEAGIENENEALGEVKSKVLEAKSLVRQRTPYDESLAEFREALASRTNSGNTVALIS